MAAAKQMTQGLAAESVTEKGTGVVKGTKLGRTRQSILGLAVIRYGGVRRAQRRYLGLPERADP